MHPRARTLIDELRLQPHPEGGFYRELYRSTLRVQPDDARTTRTALTTIYFLLPAGCHSRWHRVTSDEVWHLYEGDPLELLLADAEVANVQSVALAAASPISDPVYTVSAGWWQAARPQGEYTLVGCTVAPSFEFADFSFLRDDRPLADKLQHLRPEWGLLL